MTSRSRVRFVAWSLVFFVAFYNAYQGVKSIDQDVINAVRVMRASRRQMLRMVVLPAVFSWVFAAYLLAQAVTIPIYGRLADLYGRKRVFFAGTGIFLLGSALCGCAWGMVPLVLFPGTRRTRRSGGAASTPTLRSSGAARPSCSPRPPP